MKISSRYIAAIFSVLLVGLIIYYFSDIVAYVIVAWVLSLIGQPFMRFFKRYIRIGKYEAGTTTCAILTLFSFMLILVLLLRMLVPPVIQQARNLAEVDYASIAEGLEEPINDWNNWAIEKGLIEGEIQPLPSEMDSDTTSQNDTIAIDIPIPSQKEETNIVETTTIAIDSLLMANGDTIAKTNINLNILVEHRDQGQAAKVADPTAVVKESDSPIERLQKELFSLFNPSQIQTLFSSIIGFFGDLMLALMSVLFITFFFLKEQQLFVRSIMKVVPNRLEQKVDSAFTGITAMLTRYFGGIFIQVTIITLYVSVCLGLLGIENALLIGFFAALINVIPYVGPTIGAAFGVFIVISANIGMPFYDEMLPLLLKVLLVFATMQALDNFILQPFIFSNSVLAHPLEIFIIILVGAKLGGILGMVLAIPVYTVLRVVARVFLSEFQVVQKLTEGMKM